MPQPNPFPSSPSLRDPSKQALDERFLSRPKPMSRPKPSPFHNSIRRFSSRRPRPSVASIADIFVGSLVVAGFCREHSPRNRGLSTLPLATPGRNLQRSGSQSVASRAQALDRRRLQCSGSLAQSRSRSWFRGGPDLVQEGYIERYRVELDQKDENTSGSGSDQLAEPSWDQSQNRHTANTSTETPVDTPPSLTRDQRLRITISSLFDRLLGENHGWPEAVEALLPQQTSLKAVDDSRDAIDRPSVAAFVDLLYSDEHATTQQLFRLYRDLPSPGVANLSKESRGRLLRQFANPPNRRAIDARRYLALVEDMIKAGLPMSRSLWSSAIHLAGRGGNGKVFERNMIQAIGLWQQMEHIAGIKADEVVFNILFDIAIKGHQFIVAHRLEVEMQKRGIGFSRDGLVSKIYYYGMQKDVEGIRNTFDKFVDSGELVDTVVLNCLIAAFLRAGDMESARQLYGQMMEAQKSAQGTNSPSSHIPSLSTEFTLYRAKTRELGRMLRGAKSLRKRLPESHRAIQSSVPMTPDTRTFYIFLRHCVHGTGDLSMFMSVLHDMEKTFAVPPRHFVYILLFEGFAIHGRRKRSSWSVEKLRLAWHSFIRAVRDSQGRQPGRHSDRMAWENPLENVDVDDTIPTSAATETDAVETNASEELYMPLLSTSTGSEAKRTEPSEYFQGPPTSAVSLESHFNVDREASPDTIQSTASLANPSDSESEPLIEEHEFTEVVESGTGTELNGVSETHILPDELGAELNRQHHEYLLRRVDNGIFIGRRMVIVILRAFGTCCGPREVMEAWLQLERFWSPSKRKAIDMVAIKEVLDEQMSRSGSNVR